MVCYAIKDSKGNYVGENSLFFCKQTNKWKYSYSPFLTNGFITYPTENICLSAIEKITKIAEKIGFKEIFKPVEVNLIEVIMKEKSMKPPKMPIKYVQLDLK